MKMTMIFSLAHSHSLAQASCDRFSSEQSQYLSMVEPRSVVLSYVLLQWSLLSITGRAAATVEGKRRPESLGPSSRPSLNGLCARQSVPASRQQQQQQQQSRIDRFSPVVESSSWPLIPQSVSAAVSAEPCTIMRRRRSYSPPREVCALPPPP